MDDVYDAIGEMISSCIENGKDEDEVMRICEQLYSSLK